jgi:hypothetical protein
MFNNSLENKSLNSKAVSCGKLIKTPILSRKAMKINKMIFKGLMLLNC